MSFLVLRSTIVSVACLAVFRLLADTLQAQVSSFTVETVTYPATYSAAVPQAMNNKGQVTGISAYRDTITNTWILVPWVYLPAADYGLAAGFHLVPTGRNVRLLGGISDGGILYGSVFPIGGDSLITKGFTINANGTGFTEFNFTSDSTDSSEVNAVASNGWLCGTAFPDPEYIVYGVYTRTPGQTSYVSPLDSVFAVDINSSGKTLLRSSDSAAGILQSGAVTWLPNSGGDLFPNGINEKGQVVGTYGAENKAFLYLPAADYGLPAGLHPLPFQGVTAPNASRCYLNNNGQIVAGRTKHFWNQGDLQNLTDLVPAEFKSKIIQVAGLTNSGVMAAHSSGGGATAFYILKPQDSDIITVNDDRDLRDDDPDDGVIDVDPDPDKAGDQITLRAAIEHANEKPGRQRIIFDIPGGGVPKIEVTLPQDDRNTPNSSLDPALVGPLAYRKGGLPHLYSPLKVTDVVAIDATTQPGGWVELSGEQLSRELLTANAQSVEMAVNGLEISADNCEVRGLVINRFPGIGMVLTGGGNRIAGNRIGTDPGGTVGRGNGGQLMLGSEGASEPIEFYCGGLLITSPGNMIGGPSAADRNLIAGNGYERIWPHMAFGNDVTLMGPEAHDNKIIGNYIGTDLNGNQLGANEGPYELEDTWRTLLEIKAGASGTRVGDGSPAGRNVIAGGVTIYHTADIRLLGNYIGINAAGTAVLNSGVGDFVIADSLDVEVRENHIGSAYVRWNVSAFDSSDLKFVGNHIGLLPSPVQNLRSIFLRDVSNVTIGGSAPEEGNLIAHPNPTRSFLDEVEVVCTNGTLSNIVIAGNRILPGPDMEQVYPPLALDILDDGLDVPDFGDSDGKQNYPNIAGVDYNGSELRIGGQLDVPFSQASFYLDFYAVSHPLSSGHGGRSMTYLGRGNFETTASQLGTAHFEISLPFPGPEVPGFVAATAIRVDGDVSNTSEFSGNYAPGNNLFTDSDGISDGQEQPLADRNEDGINDFEQDNVASFTSANGEPTTVEAGPVVAAGRQLRDGKSFTLNKVASGTQGTLNAPPGYFYPNGIISFEVTDLPPGGATRILLILAEDAAPETVWIRIAGGTWSNSLPITFENGGRLSLVLTDGSAGDQDGAVNGRIVAAIGPATALPPEPPLELKSERTDFGILLSWPVTSSFAELEFSPDLSAGSWTRLDAGLSLNDGRWEFPLNLAPERFARAGYFRLRR